MSMTQTLRIGGDLPVQRLGFGALRLGGPLNWAAPADRETSIKVARRAVELGVTFIDTADSYSLGQNEELLADALYPYPADLVIATKAGQARPAAGDWVPLGRPEYLRQQAELSLRRLRVERIDLFQLHRIDPKVPLADQAGALRQLQQEGKVRHVGVSEVSVAQLEELRREVAVVSVQNRYNLRDRGHEEVLEHCERENIAFIPWNPVARGGLAVSAELEGAVTGITPAQAALAWLLHRSPVIVPIPGTSNVSHLEENMAARHVALTAEQFGSLSSAVLG